MANTKRTDMHRPGEIIPANYRYVTSYALARTDNGFPQPPWNVELVLSMMRDPAIAWAQTGGLGKCSICGAHYSYGDVWAHTETGEHLHVGHDCAAKYEMLADRSEFEIELGRIKAARAAAIVRAEKEEARQAFLDEHPGLEADLKVSHPIIADIASRFREYGRLSDKQIALVAKLAHEVRNPRPVEVYTDAPEGRVTVRGEIVSQKAQEGAYGITIKMTVKVRTADGKVWLCWSTMPSIIGGEDQRGKTVEFTATLSRGRDRHFAIAKRPTGARVIEPAAPLAATGTEG